MSGPIQNTHPTTPPPPRIEPSRGEPSRAQGAGQVQPQGGNVTIPSATPGYEQQYEVRQGDTLSAIARRHNVSLDELLKANPQFDPSSVGNGIDFNRGAVGTWDALFFICTVFALLRRHVADGAANVLQAVVFVSFLWELGYQRWGPLLTFPFALLQGYIFTKTRSLTYVVIVHLLFDAIVFLAIVHAHDRSFFPFFLY